jgi:hypothetical protein
MTPEENRAHVKAWVEKNPGKRRAMVRCQTANLCAGYVRKQLIQNTGMRPSDIPDALVELKRAHLLVLRELKKENHENR